MKLKEYFNNPEYFECPDCKAQVKSRQGSAFCMNDHAFHTIFANLILTKPPSKSYIKLHKPNFAIYLFKDFIRIYKNKHLALEMDYDCFLCEKELNTFNAEWAESLIVFS